MTKTLCGCGWWHMPAHANELNCKVVSLLSPLLLLPFCSWWWVKHMTKSTRSNRAHGGRCLALLCLPMAAHLPLVVASSSAGALPVCGQHSCWGFPRQSNVLAPTKAVWGRRRRRRRCRRSCCCERNHPMRHVAQSQCAKVGRGHGLVCAGGGCSDSGTGTGAYSTRAQWWFQIYIYIHI